MNFDIAEILWEMEERMEARFLGTTFPISDRLFPDPDKRSWECRKALRKLRINRYLRRHATPRFARCAFDHLTGQQVPLYTSTRSRFTTRITYDPRSA